MDSALSGQWKTDQIGRTKSTASAGQYGTILISSIIAQPNPQASAPLPKRDLPARPCDPK